MKKLLSLILCIVFVCLALVSCAEDVIGEYLPNYNTGSVNDDEIEKLNFYIITGDGTSADAKITVPQNINSYIKEKYKIMLNVVYCTEADYYSTLTEAMNKTDEASRPDVILINSKSLFDELYSDNSLVSLNTFFNHRDFRSLNTIVDDVLLSASSIIDPTTSVSTYYTVPNNHVVGEYKYIVIDKAMARDTLHFSNAEIAKMTNDASLAELIEAIGSYYDSTQSSSSLTKEEYVAQYVKVVNGKYEDKRLLEYGVKSANEITSDSKEKNFVNVNSYPNATKDEAFLSAFAIVKHLNDTGVYTEEEEAILYNHYTKCMRIIYALNTDAKLKNLLQYGYENTNYKFVRNEKHEATDYVTLIKSEQVTYEMNPIYTGNLFISYYCDELGWNEEIYSNILRQNADAKTQEYKVSEELNNIENYLLGLLPEDGSVNSSTTIDLPSYGSTFSDVEISWTVDNENAIINSDGTLTFVAPKSETIVNLYVTVSVNGYTPDTQYFFILTVLPDVSEDPVEG